jgi:hypothetical protein
MTPGLSGIRVAPVRGIRPALAAGTALLVVGTVLVFRAFDLHSHSASDTLRPFVITMAPVWAVAIVAARLLLRQRN